MHACDGALSIVIAFFSLVLIRLLRPFIPCMQQVTGLGRKIGVGKESDVYMGQGPGGEEVVLKFARLGRTSFRSIKRNRDYLQHRKVLGRNKSVYCIWSCTPLDKKCAVRAYISE